MIVRDVLTTLLVLCGTTGFLRAEDLPPQLVARPATLPHGMIAATLAGGYDTAHVLGIPVLSATALGLVVQRGMTEHVELGLATGFELHPDAGWNREGSVALVYRAWQRDTVELAPSVMVPLSFHSGADVTSTIVFGAGLRWHATPCVLVVVAERLVPVPVRPAVALDIGADASVIVQLAERWAVVGEAMLGEVTLVGQTDRGVAPWHRLPALARLVYASEHALDVALELHGDARDPRNAAGIALSITRRL